METFTSLKQPVDNPAFAAQRRRTLEQLDPAELDPPMVDLVRRLNELPYCFTIQSCCGHFVFGGHPDPRNLERLPPSQGAGPVQYRMAYLALCLDNGEQGIALLRDLERLPAIDPQYVQFGCADWFWERQVNSYALQVMPMRHRTRDSAWIDYAEALRVQSVRDELLGRLDQLVDARL